VIAFAGNVSGDVDWGAIFDAVHPVCDGSLTTEESMRDAANLLEQAAHRIAQLGLL